ncbi:MAG TPA: FMN-binding protein [Pseudonocardiaceae bacterium]|jgi:uncharacterized protein with FMN-binding domain|nr:FMN-binding protein [Pseudonocardiaceae bacterium]
MSPLASPRARRLAGLSGLLAAIGVLVLGRAAVGQSAQHHVTLPAPTGGPTSPAKLPTGARTIDGDVVDTPYGPVQVAVVFGNGRITDVRALQTPSDAGRSIRLADLATPILRQEVLTAQSAQIDTVSGATYTSDGYAQSVQYALDHAGG